MELLRAELTYHRDGRELLRRVSLTLLPGRRLGLVGRNGVGKSTLLRLLAGDLLPTEGRVLRAPGARVALARATFGARDLSVWDTGLQALAYVRDLEAALREEERRLAAGISLERYAELTDRFEAAGGYHAEARLERTLAAFGFSPEDLPKRVSTLSGGERSRLALAAALTSQPDVLLLDEPSSHLDIRARKTLAERLAAYPGALLFASHDRALLDAVCTHVGHLEAGELTLYRGNYSSFRQAQGHLLHTAQKRAKERSKEVAALTDSAARLRGWGTPKAARQRRSIQQRLDRLQESDVQPPQRGRALSIEAPAAKGTLLGAAHLSKAYGEVVLEDVALQIRAGDKLALVGPNGTGKSTLLNMLVGNLESEHPDARLTFGKNTKVALFSQDTRGLEDDTPLLEQLSRHVSEPRARMLLALVGLSDAAYAVPSTLSEGQKARAGIARVVASEANLLVLDEPTENLDVEMIERLESALSDTDAALLLVSHDAALVDRVATRVLSLEGGALREFRGGLKGYFSGTLRLEPDLPAPTAGPTKEESEEEQLARLEGERLDLEERRLASYGSSERERARLERRFADLLNDLSELYEARHFVPAPLYRRCENAVCAEVVATEGGYHFTSNAGLCVRLLTVGAQGHLAPVQETGRCTLPWARDAVLRLVARVAFEHLGLETLQIQLDEPLSAAGFEDAGADWWVLSRRRYEVAQGYLR